MAKKFIFPIIIIIILVAVIYQTILKKEEPTFTLAEVIKGKVSQEVSETGQVKKGDKINLSFKNSGRIEKIYFEVGEKVEAGDVLARLDTVELQNQLKEAKSSLKLAQAQLAKLLAGPTQEEVQAAKTKVENSQISLNSAKENLEAVYQDSLNTLEDTYLKAYNAQNVVDIVQRTYFISSDQPGISVKENKEKIIKAVSQIKSYLDSAKTNPSQPNIDIILPLIKGQLANILDYLGIIRENCEDPAYRNVVSSTDKSSLDTQRTNINTALTNITDVQQSITSGKLQVETAEGELKLAEDNLALVTVPPRQEDIDYYQAQVEKAQAKVQILENQIQEAILRSPVDGQIVEVNKREGEIVQPVLQDIVIAILPAAPFEIEVDIYEEDIVKIEVGNPVDIFLVAFPNQVFRGKVVNIDPAEKIIEGVVYYEVSIDFEEIPEGVKPGMTADLIIKTASKEDVLVVPEDAIQKTDGKTIVEVFKNGTIEEREIETGLLGSNDLVEVISGLSEGEKVILR